MGQPVYLAVRSGPLSGTEFGCDSFARISEVHLDFGNDHSELSSDEHLRRRNSLNTLRAIARMERAGHLSQAIICN